MSLIIDKKIIKIEVHRGLPGKGVPKGGTTGQVLAKRSAEDYDTIWSNGGGGGGAFWGTIEGDIEEQTDLQEALSEKVDETVIEALEAEIAAKADFEHTHEIEDVTDLQTALAGKAAATHSHTISDVTNLQTALDAKADEADLGTLAAEDDAPADGKTYARKNSDWEEITDAAPAWGEITGDLEDQTDLQTALAGKAAATHSHTISDVTNLQTALDEKAPAYTYSTTDLTAGSSALTTGKLYFVYE